MTSIVIVAVVVFGMVLLGIAVYRWRDARTVSRRQDAVTEREQENVALWVAKQTRRAREPGTPKDDSH